MPGGIENSPQLKLYFGIQARKGKSDFKTLTLYPQNMGTLAIQHTAELETRLPKHEVRLVPTTREGVAVGEPIPHKLSLPTLNPAPAKAPRKTAPAKSAPASNDSAEEVYDISGKTAKRVK